MLLWTSLGLSILGIKSMAGFSFSIQDRDAAFILTWACYFQVLFHQQQMMQSPINLIFVAATERMKILGPDDFVVTKKTLLDSF